MADAYNHGQHLQSLLRKPRRCSSAVRRLEGASYCLFSLFPFLDLTVTGSCCNFPGCGVCNPAPASKTGNKGSKVNQPCKDRGDLRNWSLESRAVPQPLGRLSGERAGRAPRTGWEQPPAALDGQTIAEPQGSTWPQVRQLASQPWEQN